MKIRFIVIILLLLIFTNLSAFDGKRQGFLLGFGAGFSNISFKQEIDGNDMGMDYEKETGFATDFKIGFAPNNRVEIYYSSQVAWFNITNVYGDEVTISDGVAAISLSYFTSPRLETIDWCPSFYLSGGLGLSAWNTPYEDGSEAWTGSGFFFGAGYEFSRHYRFSMNVFINDPSTSFYDSTWTTKSTVLMFTLSGMAF
ncbi:MAG: hypothetical protein K9N06_07265 [Candidatus Cloacimonetes bacterium]|nr:hypothetical protein [Candidatus Cloacimonadota bacterium]